MAFGRLTIRKSVNRLKHLARAFIKSEATTDAMRINQGKILAQLNGQKSSKSLKDYEFKIFSQWGEDGIIQKLINSVEITNRTFVEIGVEDFCESNCRYLMMNNYWEGFVVDGSAKDIDRLKTSYFYWQYQLEAVTSFITKENVNDVLRQSGFGADLGVLSIDIDGNDYWIFEAITFYSPRILILEYNAVFGTQRKISVPYEPAFNRTKKHYSNLYFGASLAALTYLAHKKNYALIGTNSAGVNAFFIRADLINDKLEVLSTQDAFTLSKDRQSRDARGNLTFVGGDNRLTLIKGMPVVNVETGTLEKL